MSSAKRKSADGDTTSQPAPSQRGRKKRTPPTGTAAPSRHAPQMVSSKSNFKLTGKDLVEAFKRVIRDAPKSRNRWASAESWCDTIVKYNSAWADHKDQVTARKLSVVMNKDTAFGGYNAMRDYRQGNLHGVYANKYDFDDGNGKRVFIWSYLGTGVPNQKCPCEPTHEYFQTEDVANILVPAPRAQARTGGSTPATEERTPEKADESDVDVSQKVTPSLSNETPSPSQPDGGATPQQPKQKHLEILKSRSWFHSGDAWNLFMPKTKKKDDYLDEECERLVLAAIDARIAICDRGSKQMQRADDNRSWSWHYAVCNASPDDDITDIQKERIRYQCRYIKIALQKALKNMGLSSNHRWTWRRCSESAIELMEAVGEDYIKRAESIEEWHILMRENGDRFAHPNPLVAAGKKPEPSFLTQNPRTKIAFLRKADDYAARGELTSQAMMEYTNDILVPKALEKQNELLNPQDDSSPPETRYDFLRSFGLLKGRPPRSTMEEGEVTSDAPPLIEDICQSTIVRWLNIYGYSHDTARKHFYNDTHELPMTKADRARFIRRYLFRYEPRALRWIQIPAADAKVMREKGSVPEDAGYEYTNIYGEPVVEFHVDDCMSFSMQMNKANAFGGERSSLFINAPESVINKWVEDDMFEEENYPANAGYEYLSLVGVKMMEVHACHLKDNKETRNKLKQSMLEHNLFFSISVRSPLLIFGQDEAIFKQFIMTLKVWLGRGGKQPLRPKDEGIGLMASGIKCRDLGFGFILVEEDLKKVNKFRKEQRPVYMDEDAAKKVHGSSTKKDLASTPFLVLFDYGKNAEGYWTYDRMVLQLEDCHDVLDALFSEKKIPDSNTQQRHMQPVPNTKDNLVRQYDYVFLFDHSCGHDRKRPDGLDVNGLTKGPSPSARKMRKVTIEKEQGILGKYNHSKKLVLGMQQSMVFEEKDNFGNDETGPILQDSKCCGKYDVTEGFTDQVKNCDELRLDLENKGVNSGGTKKQLIDKCERAGISIKKTIPNVISYGFIGKSKGAFQILWERGMVKPEVEYQKDYTMNGKKDEHGNTMKDTSINDLIHTCEDFVHEKTLLQYYGEKLGSIIDRSPKCTPEIAGDGIEYEWAMSKLWYRKQPWEQKKKKEKFIKLVKEALGSNVLTIERSRHFSRRARFNMISYYMLEKDGKSTTPSDVARYKKVRKSHTCVLDELHGYFSRMVNNLIASNKK